MTRSSVVPLVIDALVTTTRTSLTAASDNTTQVSDGWFVGEESDTTDWVMFGIDDPDIQGLEVGAESDSEWAAVGRKARKQAGVVAGVVFSSNGDNDAKAARDRAYVLLDMVATTVRTDPTLGISDPAVAYVVCAYGGHETLRQVQGEGGAAAAVAFQVSFEARI